MHEGECGLKVKKLGTIGNFTQARSIFSGGGISPTLIAGMSHGNIVPYVLEITKLDDDRNQNIEQTDNLV